MSKGGLWCSWCHNPDPGHWLDERTKPSGVLMSACCDEKIAYYEPKGEPHPSRNYDREEVNPDA